MRDLAAVAGALVLSAPAAALACEGMKKEAHAGCDRAKAAPTAEAPKSCDPMKQEVASVKLITVAELVSLRAEKKATVLDANTPDFRAKNGIIPGALLLTGSATYDPAKELPASKTEKLVFYCAAEKCKASHRAAERALQAGYVDVSVMPAGLLGWKSAGQPTQPVPQS